MSDMNQHQPDHFNLQDEVGNEEDFAFNDDLK